MKYLVYIQHEPQINYYHCIEWTKKNRSKEKKKNYTNAETNLYIYKYNKDVNGKKEFVFFFVQNDKLILKSHLIMLIGCKVL